MNDILIERDALCPTVVPENHDSTPRSPIPSPMPRSDVLRFEENKTLIGPEVDDHRAQSLGHLRQHDNSGVRLQSTLRQYAWTWLLSLFSLVWIVFTICFAYNCTLANPFAASLLFSRPENTLLMLNILSHGTLILLKDLTSSVFEPVRWAFASSSIGVSAFNFIALSRATNTTGVLALLFTRSGSNGFGYNGYRLWGTQRYREVFQTPANIETLLHCSTCFYRPRVAN